MACPARKLWGCLERNARFAKFDGPGRSRMPRGCWERKLSVSYEGSQLWERGRSVIYKGSWPWERGCR
eukprot:8271542-Pyramimonas_sp.AAC.1